MPDAFDPKTQKRFQRFIATMVLIALCSVGGGALAVATTSDISLSISIGLGAAGLLLIWSGILTWRQKNHWISDMQEFFIQNKMVPFTYKRQGWVMPWEMTSGALRVLRAAAGEYWNLLEKAQESEKTLERYVGSNVSAKASRKAMQSELGGELRRVYVLFSDVRGFTRMTEQLKPEETVEILNKMFTSMEEVITANSGDINKYIGDAIFAFFRRPYGQEEEAAQLVLRTALRMQDRFEILNKDFKALYSQPVDIGLGIGITAGEAIMGNLGSANRMEFTLIGDTVNLASRLCGIAKHSQILLNEEMAEICQDRFQLQSLPPVQIKGKAGFHTPYEVIGEKLSMGR